MLRVNLPRTGAPVLPIYATQQCFDSGFEKKMSSYNRTPVLKKQIGDTRTACDFVDCAAEGMGFLIPQLASSNVRIQNTKARGVGQASSQSSDTSSSWLPICSRLS